MFRTFNRLHMREALAHKLERLKELQRDCLFSIDPTKQHVRLDICEGNDDGGHLLRWQARSIPPRISEILVKDDAFSHLIEKGIDEISLLAACCLSVSCL